MRHVLLALGAASLLAVTLPSAANARCHGCGVAAGVIGGLAAGAIIGSAIAGGPPAYAGEPVYDGPPPPPPPGYYADSDGPICHMEPRRVWIEGVGWRMRPIQICE